MQVDAIKGGTPTRHDIRLIAARHDVQSVTPMTIPFATSKGQQVVSLVPRKD